MKHQDKQRRFKEMLAHFSASEIDDMIDRANEHVGTIETMAMALSQPALEGVSVEAGQEAVRKLKAGQDVTSSEMLSMEAIIMPRERPVAFIIGASDGTQGFEAPADPWGHFNSGTPRNNILKALLSIGRVELPGNLTTPFAGTAFVVGDGLLMTNRHVAEIFATGRGTRDLKIRSSQAAGWDHRRLRGQDDDDTSTQLKVVDVLMIHPYWDMAVLKVAGLTAKQSKLTLSLTSPDDLVAADAEVAVIGYPAMDWRSDLQLQQTIFSNVFNVKRLQPGKIRPTAPIDSFEHRVTAMTHDSSTLGGNSGSALIDVSTGKVVGLHFAGEYRKANYAVPTYELARDPRVRALGLNFESGSVGTNSALDAAWSGWEGPSSQVQTSTLLQAGAATVRSGRTVVSVPVSIDGGFVTVPLDVTISDTGRRNGREAAPLPLEATMRPPIVFPNLDDRKGFNPDFLRLTATQIFPPELTPAGREIAAPLDSGGYELHYHKFSIVMHKYRRMALFTASNVDWHDELRTINGKRPTRKQLTGLPDGAAEQWLTDDRLAEKYQLPDVFYTKDGGAFDKGHLVRRDDVCWGTSLKDIQKGNGDTYHTTNCSPQVAGFNQSAKGEDNWGDLENLVQKQAHAERVIIFSGPVLAENDLRFEGLDKRGDVSIQIPGSYWKIIVAAGQNGPEAFGFVLKQDLSNVPLEFSVPKPWQRYMRRIADIEKLLFGWASLNALKPYDQFDVLKRRRAALRPRR